MKQPESIIKRHVFEYLCMCPEFFGWVQPNGGVYDPTRKAFRRLSGGQRKGVSDIIGLWNGQGLAVEIKTPTGRLSPEQKLFQSQFIEAGGLALVVRSVSEAVDWVAAMRIVAS